MKSYVRKIILFLTFIVVSSGFFAGRNALGLEREPDFFPLDIWEEMEAWERDKATASKHLVEGKSPSVAVTPEKTEYVYTSFPFDAWQEINDTGDTHRDEIKKISGEYSEPRQEAPYKKKKPNPYWYPEELETR